MLLLLLLGASSMLAPMAMNMHVPAAGEIAASFELERARASLTVTVYLWVFGSTMLLVGLPADRFGRRPTLLGGLILLALGASVAALSIEGIGDVARIVGGWLGYQDIVLSKERLFQVMLVARAVEAVGAASIVVTPRTMINDRVQGPEAMKLLGLLGTIMAAAPALAPIFGELLSSWFGWPSIFGFQALVALVLLVLCVPFLPETQPEVLPANKVALPVEGEFRTVGAVVAPVSVMALMTAVYFAYLAAGADAALVHFDEGSGALAALLASLATIYVLGNITVTRIAHRFLPTHIIRFGSLFTLASLPIILLGKSYFLVGAGMCVYAFGNGLVMPTALAMAGSVEPRLRARVMSVASSTPFLLGGALALLATSLKLTTWPRFQWLMVACVVLCVATAWLLMTPRKSRRTSAA